MEKKLPKPRRGIPVPIKAKPPPSHTERRLRKTSNTEKDKENVNAISSNGSTKPHLEVKGPFNPSIVARFKDPNEKPRHRYRSASETRKEKPKRLSPATRDDLHLHTRNVQPKETTVTCAAPVKKISRPHSVEKKRSRPPSVDSAQTITDLKDEKEVLFGAVKALKERVNQYENVMKAMKVDPTSLQELLLNEENIAQQRSEASKNAEQLKEMLLQNLSISQTINQGAQEIFAFGD